MFSRLPQSFYAATEPLRAIHYGWKHHKECIPDEDDSRRVSKLYDVTEALATLGSLCVLGSPFLQSQSEALFKTGQTAMLIAGVYSLRLTFDFATYGREALAQQERIKALSGRSSSPQP